MKVIYCCPRCGEPSGATISPTLMRCESCAWEGNPSMFPATNVDEEEADAVAEALMGQVVQSFGQLVARDMAVQIGKVLLGCGLLQGDPLDPQELAEFLRAIARSMVEASLEVARAQHARKITGARPTKPAGAN